MALVAGLIDNDEKSIYLKSIPNSGRMQNPYPVKTKIVGLFLTKMCLKNHTL